MLRVLPRQPAPDLAVSTLSGTKSAARSASRLSCSIAGCTAQSARPILPNLISWSLSSPRAVSRRLR
jgi:hypothetical protein